MKFAQKQRKLAIFSKKSEIMKYQFLSKNKNFSKALKMILKW